MMKRNINNIICVLGLFSLFQPLAYSGPVIVFNDNGAWCWYQDERVIIHNGKLIIGSVADSSGTNGASRNGNVEVVEYDIDAGGPAVRTVIHTNFQDDDHDTAAFLPLPDNRILALYTKHLSDQLIHYRTTTNPNDTTSWSADATLTRNASVTYSNVYRLSAENGGSGRIYNFYRGENFNPNFVTSDDNGQTWNYGLAGVAADGHLIRKDGQRPYVRYTSNNVDKFHFISTEAHPRDYNNSIYYGCLYQGSLYAADGTWLHNTADGPIVVESLEKLYQGGVNNVAWTTGIRLDANGYPYIAFSVQMNQDMNDIRYWYGRWDGAQWHVNEMAYAGSALYAAESDYSGLVSLDPHNPNTVYISADVHPLTGQALISQADGRRHYELFRGTTTDMGTTWIWEYITKNSTEDNLRPIVPEWDGRTVLLWMRGTYSSYTNYDLDIVGMFDPEPVDPDAPVITANPTSVSVRPGHSAVLSIQAESPLIMDYQWYKVVDGDDDFPVGDGTDTLTFQSVQESDEGQYYCVVSNTAGSVQSLDADIVIMQLLVHLSLDNTYTDITGNGYDASPVGDPVFTTGHDKQAIELDGNDYMSVQNGQTLDLFTGGTVSAWIKTDQLPTAWATLAGKGRYSWRLCQYDANGTAAFHFNSASAEYQANGNDYILDNQWHHLVGVYNGQSVLLYVDGLLDASASTSEDVNITNDPVYVGNRSDAARYWQGLVDDVRIYSYALTPETVSALYNGHACYEVIPYDLNSDCRVNLADIMMFLEEWPISGQ